MKRFIDQTFTNDTGRQTKRSSGLFRLLVPYPNGCEFVEWVAAESADDLLTLET